MCNDDDYDDGNDDRVVSSINLGRTEQDLLVQESPLRPRVVYKFLSSRSFVKSRWLWDQRTHMMDFSASFVGGSGGMLPWKMFENWNAGERISGILGHEAKTSVEIIKLQLYCENHVTQRKTK